MNAGTDKAKPAPRLISDYRLAILAAIMGKPPADALRLWWQSKLLLMPLDAEPDLYTKLKAVDLFADNASGLTMEECLRLEKECVRCPIEDAMKAIGVYSEKTLVKLYAAFCDEVNRAKGKTGYTTALGPELKRGLQNWRRGGIERGTVEDLKRFRREQNAQRGRMNRLAVKKVKRRKPVK